MHQCPGSNCAANAATSLALCKHTSVLPFLVQSMSLNMDKNTMRSSNNCGSGIQVNLNRIRVRSILHPIVCPNCGMDLHSRFRRTM